MSADVYATAREGLSRFFTPYIEDNGWEDGFHDAFIAWQSNGEKQLGTGRAVVNYFIKATRNRIHKVRARRVLEDNAARTRYCNRPMVSPRYQMDGDYVFAIRNLHEDGYSCNQLSEASGYKICVVRSIVALRTYKGIQ